MCLPALAKAELFKSVREGRIRILLGSTLKMGVGTNIQTRLAALHHLDAPWRPSDVEQREGRIIRQGNLNEEVRIVRYVTEASFDAYSLELRAVDAACGQPQRREKPVDVFDASPADDGQRALQGEVQFLQYSK